MPDFLTLKEASKRTGYTADYIGQLVRDGKIKAHRVGKSWVVDRQSLTDYLSSIGRVALDKDMYLPTAEEVAEKVPEPKAVVTLDATTIEEVPSGGLSDQIVSSLSQEKPTTLPSKKTFRHSRVRLSATIFVLAIFASVSSPTAPPCSS